MQNIESATLTTSNFVQIAQNKYFSICTNSVPFEPPGMTKTNNILPTSMQFQAQGIYDNKKYHLEDNVSFNTKSSGLADMEN